MSEYAPEGSRITTIENYEKRIRKAEENFARAGKEEKITLLKGDAADLLKETSLSVSEIGSSCGFGSSSYFGKLFKEKYGVSPLGYRQGSACAVLSETGDV